jgi:hypothetical protein
VAGTLAIGVQQRADFGFGVGLTLMLTKSDLETRVDLLFRLLSFEVGEYSTMIPTHWSIMVTYADQAEMVAIEDIASRDLEAFCLNPIDSYLPMRLPVRLRGIYEMNWVYPTLLPNELLAIPIGTPRKRSDSETSREPGPLCILAGEKLKIPDTIDVGSLW